jgi:hypothetical protein
MAIVERHVQFGIKNQATYKKWEQGWAEVESRLGGFPPKRHLSLLSGVDNVGTMVWEREWESMAVMEAAGERLFSDPQVQKLLAKYDTILDGERIEYYFVERIT